MCVVQNDIGKAERLRREFPSMRVVYRITTQDSPDDNAQDIYAPEDYLNRSINMGSFAEAARLGCWLYISNEPVWSRSLDWCQRVGELAIARGWKTALGSWSVGIPEPHEIPLARNLLAFAHKYRGQTALAFHPYFPWGYAAYDAFGATLRNYRDWPKVAPPDTHIVGRDRRIVNYARSLGYRIEIMHTEYGSDSVHAADDMRRLARASVTDRFGWQLAKLRYPEWGHLGLPDAETLYAKSLSWVWNTFYAPYPEFVGAALFCFGRFGDWRFYDVSDNQYLLQKIASEDFPVNAQATPAYVIKSSGATLTRARASGVVVNVRALPHTGAQVVAQIKPGDVVEYYADSDASGNGFAWRRLPSGAWFALVPGLTLEPVSEARQAIEAQLAVIRAAADEIERLAAALE
jgi:hypothetical protein